MHSSSIVDATTFSDVYSTHLAHTGRLLVAMLNDRPLRAATLRAAHAYISCLIAGGKLLFAGNGGSAADSQHMAAEYVSRFMYDRPGLPAVALTTDSSILTAVGNDYGFVELFARQIQALGREGDVFVAYSTSGTSENILRALNEARLRKIICVGFTGSRGGPMRDLCDILLEAPSHITSDIQEAHLVLGHLICRIVEQHIFPLGSL